MRILRPRKEALDERDVGASDDQELLHLRCSTLLFRDDAVLLCQRTGGDKRWVMPGGTPRQGEGAAAAAQREVAEETGLIVHTDRVAFVLDTTSRDAAHHLIEIVFVGTELEGRAEPRQLEQGLRPEFVSLRKLVDLKLRPPIAGYIRGHATYHRTEGNFRDPFTAAYLGNLWRADDVDDALVMPQVLGKIRQGL